VQAASASSSPSSRAARKAHAPLPCTPKGYESLVELLQYLSFASATLAMALQGRHLQVALGQWRLLDWMELGGTGTVGVVLCCLAGCLALPGSATSKLWATQLSDDGTDGLPSRGALIDEVRAAASRQQSAGADVYQYLAAARLTGCLTSSLGNGGCMHAAGGRLLHVCMQCSYTRTLMACSRLRCLARPCSWPNFLKYHPLTEDTKY
jgi:hypothetical protein